MKAMTVNDLIRTCNSLNYAYEEVGDNELEKPIKFCKSKDESYDIGYIYMDKEGNIKLIEKEYFFIHNILVAIQNALENNNKLLNTVTNLLTNLNIDTKEKLSQYEYEEGEFETLSNYIKGE